LFDAQLLHAQLFMVKRWRYAGAMARDGMPKELPDDFASLWQLTRRIGTVMDRRSDAICRQELGTSFAQFLVLSVVDAYPGELNQQTIADRLGLTKGTVSRQLDAAAAAGLMTVQPARHSRRENTVALTAAGTALVRKGDAALDAPRDAVSRTIDAEQLRATVQTLRAVLAAVDPAE
jgi:DNA-binding MarR family transcriptional regulator